MDASALFMEARACMQEYIIIMHLHACLYTINTYSLQPRFDSNLRGKMCEKIHTSRLGPFQYLAHWLGPLFEGYS